MTTLRHRYGIPPRPDAPEMSDAGLDEDTFRVVRRESQAFIGPIPTRPHAVRIEPQDVNALEIVPHSEPGRAGEGFFSRISRSPWVQPFHMAIFLTKLVLESHVRTAVAEVAEFEAVARRIAPHAATPEQIERIHMGLLLARSRHLAVRAGRPTRLSSDDETRILEVEDLLQHCEPVVLQRLLH